MQVPDFSGETCPVFPSDTLGNGGCTGQYTWVKADAPFPIGGLVSTKGLLLTRHTNLCGDIEDTTLHPFSVISVVLRHSHEVDSLSQWCEVGFDNQRFLDDDDIPTIFRCKFTESFRPGPYRPPKLFLFDPVPIDGVERVYGVSLNTESTELLAIEDADTFWVWPPDPAWDGITGNDAQWFAETQYRESEIMGTIDDPSYITACSVKVFPQVDFTHVFLDSLDDIGKVYSTDTALANCIVISDTMFIWHVD